MKNFGARPRICGFFEISLPEVMYYLYLPVRMQYSDIKLPQNVECCRPLIERAIEMSMERKNAHQYRYIYLSARKGWATPDSPLNRPGWHCDGFGTNDLNYVWWKGPGTRFAIQEFKDISSDHNLSLKQFEEQVVPENVITYQESSFLELTPDIVHATPIIEAPGCMRQYIKISLSDHKYNLHNNSHNYLFDYKWDMVDRELLRNDTYAAQKDYAEVADILSETNKAIAEEA